MRRNNRLIAAGVALKRRIERAAQRLRRALFSPVSRNPSLLAACRGRQKLHLRGCPRPPSSGSPASSACRPAAAGPARARTPTSAALLPAAAPCRLSPAAAESRRRCRGEREALAA